MYESINILKRLKNLAVDELQGAQQRSTEMNKFNVKVITPPAFVQFSDFHGELKSLLSKIDSVNRGFISTLILLTQTAGKQTYSNPETIKKIVAMIDKVLANSYEKIQANLKQGQEKTKSYSDIVENSRAMIARLKDEIQTNISSKAANKNEILFYNNDIIFLQRTSARREKRITFSNSLCEDQSQLVDKHYRRYVETINQVNDLRSSLSVE